MKLSLFFFIILFYTNCSASKQTSVSRQQTDSIHQSSRLTIKTASIPESRASLTVPVGTLKELPAGAAFVQKSGQATAEIRFLHDTLFVYATCDSLQALIYQYEKLTNKLSKQERIQQKETEKETFLPTILFLFIFSLIVGIISYKVFRNYFNFFA